nr:transposase [Streptobacillus canis]
MELINILEELDLTEFKKMFQYKTKINPIRLLAVIIYAYSRKVKSLREIENYCNENIKFKYLLDGTKLKAYANKYTFVWKKAVIKNKEKNKIKIIELISEFNSYYVIKKHTNC